ncbi:MAG TPA: UDP-N-acetylmuramoyl-tripeptide--D-alanyl-D-alanine ligase [Pseudobdellovibrionaceae bacterium]|nr:UDP-N-acetylmuramoyl-tripeptide--D-alanyl-D-alanine ligase [Pseudobdellovibrionaceae bacterium]
MAIKEWSLDQVVKATQGEILSSPFVKFVGIGTDTRQDLTGKLFVALKGDQYDAHEFLIQAVDRGAHGLLVNSGVAVSAEIRSRCSVIAVQDTLRGLQDLSHYFRQENSQMQFLAVTGSNGKTTTKEFAAQMISTERKTHWSHASFNNHWGVPLTLLNTPVNSEVVIVEMGMNHAKELTRLVEIAEPQVVLCTMVGRAHLEHFKSMEVLASAKYEIYESASPRATRIYNKDNPWTLKMFQEDQVRFPDSKKITFSQKDPKSDIFFQLETVTFDEIFFNGHILDVNGRSVKGSSRVKVFGIQNLINLMAASALALSCGLTPEQIWKALSLCKTSWGRNQIEVLSSGAILLFDAYNANPDSMMALLDNLKRIEVSGRKVAILGQMLEMGKNSPLLHEELGRKAAESALDEVYFLGAPAEGAAFQKGFESYQNSKCRVLTEFDLTVAQEISQKLKSGDLIALKASRGMKLERFVAPLSKSRTEL